MYFQMDQYANYYPSQYNPAKKKRRVLAMTCCITRTGQVWIGNLLMQLFTFDQLTLAYHSVTTRNDLVNNKNPQVKVQLKKRLMARYMKDYFASNKIECCH